MKKATQLYVCKCMPFSTHVWEKPLTCLFPPELSVDDGGNGDQKDGGDDKNAFEDNDGGDGDDEGW